MSERGIDRLCAVAAQIEQQANVLQRLGFKDTARLLEMAVLDLNRHVYSSRILRNGPKVEATKSAKAKPH
jgi:hypothetical protein